MIARPVLTPGEAAALTEDEWIAHHVTSCPVPTGETARRLADWLDLGALLDEAAQGNAA
jgi:hypothetical protein